MKPESSIEINLDSVKDKLRLTIYARRPKTLFDAQESAEANNEARFQLIEGCYYDFNFSEDGYTFGKISDNIVQPHTKLKHTGTISPNIYVGTLFLPVVDEKTGSKCAVVKLEVQSVKTGYRDDYRDMLEFITEKCADLLMQFNSPIFQNYDIDFTNDSKSLYQKFAFIKSVIESDEFADSVHRIVSSPVTKWNEISESKDIRQVRRFTGRNVKELIRTGNRTSLPESHYLREHGLNSLPERISSIRKTDSADTPENRFIKYALEVFLKFCTDINDKAKILEHQRLYNESEQLAQELENHLHHSVFSEVSRPVTLKLNSPVLQRKEGYREILRIWLMFDLAAKLIWSGGDDVYDAGKKDIATLYEYWLFFKLLELFQEIFQIEHKDITDLISVSNNGLNLQIKQGKFTALSGVYDSGTRKLKVSFSYNRSFSGKSGYPKSGSWTTTLRPDYTLSFWPADISEKTAEKQELIVHVHFDAKYKIANLDHFLDSNFDGNLDDEKVENKKGIYKNADLLKMHSYKDAIRRTGGAYVLYPGDKSLRESGFHEIIPGLGAFPVRPAKENSGIEELKAFVVDILDHFLNRASQREKVAYRTYDIYKNPPKSDEEVREALPETYNENRGLLPDETSVLVGFYKSEKHYKWIEKNKRYNMRTGDDKGSLILDELTISAKYLLLHTHGNATSGDLWKIVSKGPKIISKSDLMKSGYPDPKQDYYLVVDIEPVNDPEFENVEWDFKKLSGYSGGRASAIPFTASLSELMRNKVLLD